MTTAAKSNITVFVDGSTHGDLAFQRAVHIKKPEDHLDVVHIAELLNPLAYASVGLAGPAFAPTSIFVDANEDLKTRGRTLASKYAQYLSTNKIPDTTTFMVSSHRVESSAIQFIKAHNTDVVVVGSRGLGAFKRFFLGSFSHHLVNHAPCDVIVVRSDADKTAQKKEDDPLEDSLPASSKPEIISGYAQAEEVPMSPRSPMATSAWRSGYLYLQSNVMER